MLKQTVSYLSPKTAAGDPGYSTAVRTITLLYCQVLVETHLDICSDITKRVIVGDRDKLAWTDCIYANCSIVSLIDNDITREQCPKQDFFLERLVCLFWIAGPEIRY